MQTNLVFYQGRSWHFVPHLTNPSAASTSIYRSGSVVRVEMPAKLCSGRELFRVFITTQISFEKSF